MYVQDSLWALSWCVLEFCCCLFGCGQLQTKLHASISWFCIRFEPDVSATASIVIIPFQNQQCRGWVWHKSSTLTSWLGSFIGLARFDLSKEPSQILILVQFLNRLARERLDLINTTIPNLSFICIAVLLLAKIIFHSTSNSNTILVNLFIFKRLYYSKLSTSVIYFHNIIISYNFKNYLHAIVE
jgi:hypothetical protein